MAMFVTVENRDQYNQPTFDTITIHVGCKNVQSVKRIVDIQADGDELVRCCAILGRQLPPSRVYTFFGDNAKEIAANW